MYALASFGFRFRRSNISKNDKIFSAYSKTTCWWNEFLQTNLSYFTRKSKSAFITSNQFLSIIGLHNLYHKPWNHLDLFLSSHMFWLITINKIIFIFLQHPLYPLSLSFPSFSLVFTCFCFPFLFHCLLHFRSGDLFSFFANFFISSFKFFLIFVVSIQFSSFISLASFRVIIS